MQNRPVLVSEANSSSANIQFACYGLQQFDEETEKKKLISSQYNVVSDIELQNSDNNNIEDDDESHVVLQIEDQQNIKIQHDKKVLKKEKNNNDDDDDDDTSNESNSDIRKKDSKKNDKIIREKSSSSFSSDDENNDNVKEEEDNNNVKEEEDNDNDIDSQHKSKLRKIETTKNTSIDNNTTSLVKITKKEDKKQTDEEEIDYYIHSTNMVESIVGFFEEPLQYGEYYQLMCKPTVYRGKRQYKVVYTINNSKDNICETNLQLVKTIYSKLNPKGKQYCVTVL